MSDLEGRAGARLFCCTLVGVILRREPHLRRASKDAPQNHLLPSIILRGSQEFAPQDDGVHSPTSVNCNSSVRWIIEKLSSDTMVTTVSPSAVTWVSMPSMLSIS